MLVVYVISKIFIKEAPPPGPSAEEVLLTEIRDELRNAVDARKCGGLPERDLRRVPASRVRGSAPPGSSRGRGASS